GGQPRQDHRPHHPLRRREAVRPRPRGFAPRAGGLHRTQVHLHSQRLTTPRLPRRSQARPPPYDDATAPEIQHTMNAMTDPTQLEQWDRAHFFHPSTHMAQHAHGEAASRIITGGKGVFIEDANGRRSLDAFAGLYCVNIGYGREEVAEAIARQARTLPYYHAYVGHGAEVSITLARMIAERAPEGF